MGARRLVALLLCIALVVMGMAMQSAGMAQIVPNVGVHGTDGLHTCSADGGHADAQHGATGKHQPEPRASGQPPSADCTVALCCSAFLGAAPCVAPARLARGADMQAPVLTVPRAFAARLHERPPKHL